MPDVFTLATSAPPQKKATDPPLVSCGNGTLTVFASGRQQSWQLPLDSMQLVVDDTIVASNKVMHVFATACCEGGNQQAIVIAPLHSTHATIHVLQADMRCISTLCLQHSANKSQLLTITYHGGEKEHLTITSAGRVFPRAM